MLWLGGFQDVLHHWELQVLRPLPASSGLALPLLPEELTHFWLQQGRACPVPLALLSLCFHSSLMFNVSK